MGLPAFSFLEMGFWFERSRLLMADQREAHCVRVPSNNFHRRLALLPSTLFCGVRCQVGVLNLERVLPSRTQLDIAVASDLGS